VTGAAGHHVVFFDGVCGLCDRTVRFLLTHDRHDRLRFAPLQGPFAQRTLPALGGRPERLETIYVLTSEGRLLQRSRAVLFAAVALGGGWRLLAVLKLVPRPLADFVYGLVARVRYRVFGRLEACAIPSPQERARFLEATLEPAAETTQTTVSSTGR
jgi:predicted DCC family thiol-disulfide oxidoreductase YuxK